MNMETYPAWCYAKKLMVKIQGKVLSKNPTYSRFTPERSLITLKVTDCDLKKCDKRNVEDCLIGKRREGVY